MSNPIFTYVGAVDGDTTEGDWSIAAVCVFCASWGTEDKTSARLTMQEIRDNGVETKNKSMIIRNGRACTEDGKEIRAQSASIWGTSASAAVTTCDVVCTVVTAVACWAVGTVFTAGLCDQVCTAWDDMWEAIDNLDG